MARVVLEGVRKVYDNGFVAVHGIDLEVRDGEFVVLVGPSGCGKSTTLRIIAGLEALSAGSLWIGDRLVNTVPPKDRDIAMVFQNYALYPHMSVAENMSFALRLRKLPREEITRRVEDAAEVLGITEVLDRKPRQLSGGQRQRVAIGRAIVRQPQVFLFDEPLSNLDAKLRVQMRKEIAGLQRQLNATVVYVTHDQVEAMTLGDRIVVLDRGYVQQIGAPLEVYDHPANRFVAGFIGSPAMNLIDGAVVQGEGGAVFRSADGGLLVALGGKAAERGLEPGSAATFGIRPEDLRPADAAGEGWRRLGDFSVDLVEPLGNEMLLYARSGRLELTSRFPPQSLPARGEPVSLSFRPDRVHLFPAG